MIMALPVALIKPKTLGAERIERSGLKGISILDFTTNYSLTSDSLSSSFYGKDKAMNLPLLHLLIINHRPVKPTVRR